MNQRTVAFTLTIALAVLFAPNQSARAQGGILKALEGLFAPAQREQQAEVAVAVAEDVMVVDVVQADMAVGGVGFKNMYTPHLEKVLTVELHFVRKVCQPTEEQFDAIHLAGLKAVVALAKTYEKQQQLRKQANQWPRPRPKIRQVLLEAVQQHLSTEVASKFAAEMEAREKAERDANAGTILAHMDKRLLLTPDQHQKIGQRLREEWKEGWTTGSRLFMYPQYSKLPEEDFLKNELSKLQLSMWSSRDSNVSVNFGWQMELELQDSLGGGVNLKAFPKPNNAQEPAADDNQDDEAGQQAGDLKQ